MSGIGYTLVHGAVGPTLSANLAYLQVSYVQNDILADNGLQYRGPVLYSTITITTAGASTLAKQISANSAATVSTTTTSPLTKAVQIESIVDNLISMPSELGISEVV